jgi:hypothetical protein
MRRTPAIAPLERTLLEEGETVLDTTPAPSDEEDVSELDWRDDTVIASALLGNNEQIRRHRDLRRTGTCGPTIESVDL